MVVGFGIFDALSCGGGSCAVVSDTTTYCRLERERVGVVTFRCTCS